MFGIYQIAGNLTTSELLCDVIQSLGHSLTECIGFYSYPLKGTT